MATSEHPQFASVLKNASANHTFKPRTPLRAVRPAGVVHAAMLDASGPSPISRSEILANAQQLMNVPYVWGGNSATGLDCSAFVSRAWGVGRHTTDSLSSVARPIAKDELQAGDALNLTTSKDPEGAGHIRLFDRWANADHTQMWVYEETPPRSLHHVINWDSHYTPMRRVNTVDQ